jgi:DNA ligase (NAD+)
MSASTVNEDLMTAEQARETLARLGTNPYFDPHGIDFADAVELAQQAARAYYVTGTVLLTDAQFDELVEMIEFNKRERPDWDDKGVTTAVAAGAVGKGDVTHPSPMLSLDKSKTQDEVIDFIARLAGAPAVVEFKLDGLAFRSEYENGRLVLAATRGDGITGEDLTAQALREPGITGLPAVLPTPWTGEVRGEVFMTDTDFEAANINRVAAGSPAFVNPRNATAGSLRNIDRTYETPMTYAAYDISGEQVDGTDSHAERMQMAHALGFGTAYHLAPGVKVATDATDVLDAIDAIGQDRATLGFPIDGAVIKADSNRDRARLGYASRTPYWATAYKYAADTASSVLRDIVVTVGRTGRLALTAVIDPVFVGGTTVSRATLHNVGWVQSAGLAIGQTVAVWRAGDVIPRVTAPIGEQPHDLAPWQPPATCPQCGEEWDKSTLLWRCTTPSCGAVSALAFWCSREALDVERIGESVCEALVETGKATNVADLYDLTVEDLAALPMGTTSTGGQRLLGLANAREIVSGLETSKAQPFNRVITGLGIRMTGKSVGRWLAARFKTMDALRAATVEEIAEIDKMGLVKAQSVVDGLRQMGPVIDRLAAHGVSMAVVDDGGAKPLAGKTYVVSGSVPGYTRTTIAERIEALGGTASSSVSAKTTALVTSETTTSKAKKAASLSIPVIDPAEFATLLA